MKDPNSIFTFDNYDINVIDGAFLFNRFYSKLLSDAENSKQPVFLPPYASTILAAIANTFAEDPITENRLLREILRINPAGKRPALSIHSQITQKGNLSVTFVEETDSMSDNFYYQYLTPAFERPVNEIIFIRDINYLPRWVREPSQCDKPKQLSLNHELTKMVIIVFRAIILKLHQRFDLKFVTTLEPVFDENTLSIIGLNVMSAEEAWENATRFRTIEKEKEGLRLLDEGIRQKYEALVTIERRGFGEGKKKMAVNTLKAANISTNYGNLSEKIDQLRTAFDLKFPDWRTTPPPDDRPPPPISRRRAKR